MGIIGRIRQHSWVAVLLVGGAIIAFILGDLTKNNRQIPDMGKVNGETMTRQRFDDLVERAENNYKMNQQVSQVPSEMQSRIRENVWAEFVEETLFQEQTDKLGMQVTAAELGDMFTGKFIHPYLRQLFTNPQTGLYDTLGVRRTLENFNSMDTNMRMQWVEIEKSVRQDRMQQKYAGLMMAGLYMPKALADKVAERVGEASNVRVVALPFQSVDDSEVTLGDADYQKYYKEHKAEFRVPEENRELEFIVYPVNPTPQDLADIEANVEKTWAEFQTIEDEEIPFFVNGESNRSYDSSYVKASSFKAPFDSRIEAAAAGSFIEPAIVGNEWMMAKVMATAMRPDSLRASVIYIFNEKAGANLTTRSEEQAKTLTDSVMDLLKSNHMDFEAAVEQFSDDPAKGENHGDQQWQPDGAYGFLNEQIVNTPVGGHFTYELPNGVGYYIVKVTDKTPALKKYRVALITQEIVPSAATNDAVYATAHKFASQNRVLSSFEASAQEQNLQTRNSNVTLMGDRLPGVGNARDIVRWAFNEKTEVGMVADQVFECDGVYVIAALKDIYKKGYATEQQVRPMIEMDVRREKKAELLMARAEEAVNVGKDINSIAVKLNTVVDTLDSVSFANNYFGKFGMEPKVQSVIAATKSGLTAPVKGASAVYMVQVDSKVKTDDINGDILRSQIEQGYRNKTRQLTDVLRLKANIKDTRNEHF
ncbi:MAG: SurA N-terminal domain-containing protein [Bacteroidales bacterium]|nr:SurA N-terminal domain-containing protein [Bacteroidales bacterium]